ncbi:SDR family NAD(P)-dependent oxidoreductase [Streptomyces hesseae]|uniref:SDR family NAD(P)-dependent oxidoreductase n=1 Tax=Streptomyces hesseae TaxID=3075519 RepID=A0ABU2SKJ9_9ACTN|nr:SDR family NAD(P)-dependent oxidoreductase [Streptomyces sp. DSM 40473]MDT0448439.1 SDR family NAD(P)-dependent oxidoreductase [Streptomyces sp. DSM 40473]
MRPLAAAPVAIVGIAGMFPEANDVREFWDNVVSGRDCTAEVPPAWWSLDDHYDPDPFAPDRTYARRGAFLTPPLFDPRAFGMTPRAVDSTGLVQLLGMMVAEDVLSDAGCPGAAWYDPARTGVVLGVCGTNSTLIPLAARLLGPALARAVAAHGAPEEEARRIVRAYLERLPTWTEDSFPGVLGNVVAGRIANRFDLGAANHTVDAACASSLAALRAAVDELVSHRADLMITGGCDADNSIVSFMCFSKTPALSPSGRVRPFDAGADGTLIGEGVGMLALRRLADAERDGQRIYAVLRGLGGSSDGRGTSIYAPCGDGQLAALRRAYRDADCPPRSVGLIEAHGTGTPAGDEVELAALNRLMAPGPADEGTAGEEAGGDRFVAVGSVKSQIGHTKAAAGAAGLIKAALALHHKVLPPTLHVERPGPEAARADSVLYLNTAARPWIHDPGRPVRRAGVSAFGFGGVNYHAVLEEHRPSSGAEPPAGHRVPRALLWHAPGPAELLARLERGEDPDEGPVPPGHARLGFVAADAAHRAALLATAVEQLRNSPGRDAWRHKRGVHYRRTALPEGTRVGALFAGQGSQYVGMGLGALLAVPPVRAAFDAAGALFPPSDTLARTVFPPPCPAGDARRAEERLRRTAYAQPAVGALAMGQYRFLTELGLAPHAVLGHSFGELTALWAAGVLDDAALPALARARGLAMEEVTEGTDPGSLVAVRAPEERVRELLAAHPGLAVSCRNAPDEQVLGGPTPLLERFMTHCAELSVPVRRLPVAAAFHTPLVARAHDAFAAACAATDFAAPRLRVYANTAGAAYGHGPDADRRTLAEQLRNPVDFAARVREMHEDGVGVFVEFGPRRVLTALVERTLAGRRVETVACDTGPDADGAAALKEAALRLAVLGLPLVGLNRYDAPTTPGRPAPSKVARRLEGPNFAAVASQRAADRRAGEPKASWGAMPGITSGAAVPPADAAALTRAAAEHLAAHTRFLDGQLATSEELSRLLRAGAANGGVDGSLAAAVRAIADHNVAVGQAHTHASEVVARLLGPDTPDLPQVTAPVTPPVTAPDAPAPAPAPDRSALAELVAAHRDGEPDRPATGRPPAVDREELDRVFRQVVAEKTGYDVDMIEPHLSVQEDLGIDSLKQVEIAAEVWRRYPAITREELFRFSEARTVAELSEMLERILAAPDRALRHAEDVPLGRAFPVLRPLPAVDVRTDAYPDRPCAVLLDDGGALCAAAAGALRPAGWRVLRLLLPGVRTGAGTSAEDVQVLADLSEEALVRGVDSLLTAAERVDLCAIAMSRPAGTGADEVIARLRHAVLVAKHLCPPLKESAARGTRAAFVALTGLDGRLGYAGAGGDPVAALAGGLGGLVKSVALEASPLFCRALDVAPELSADAIGAAFLAEVSDCATDVREVGWDGTLRRTPVLAAAPEPVVPARPAPADLSADDLLLVTGGASGITAWCVAALAAERPCGFVLLGRTGLAADQADEPPRQRRIRSLVEELRSLGAEAHYVAADVRDATALATALAPYAGRVTGVVHGAGVLGDSTLGELAAESVARVVDTKLAGLHNVLSCLDPDRLRRLVLFASVSGYWGNVRQTDYALANEALTRYGLAFAAARPRCRVTPVVWGPWEGGMAARLREFFVQQGFPVLTRSTGCEHFTGLMGRAHVDGTVVIGPLRAPFTLVTEPPGAGLAARRALAGLETERALRDHLWSGAPLLPLTAAVGWGLHVLERCRGEAGPVTECRDFRVRRGLYLDGSQPGHALARLVPDPAEPGAAAVTVCALDDGRETQVLYEGRYRGSGRAPEPPRRDDLPPRPYPFRDEPHPVYAAGGLFHGPSLRGLGAVLEEGPDRLVVGAALRDPGLAHGAYGGLLYSPCLADLLVQAGALLGLARFGHTPGPVGVERVELFAPLPDGRPFVVVAELGSVSAVDLRCDVTACDPDGRVLQRWTGLTLVPFTEEELRVRLTAPRSAPGAGAATDVTD